MHSQPCTYTPQTDTDSAGTRTHTHARKSSLQGCKETAANKRHRSSKDGRRATGRRSTAVRGMRNHGGRDMFVADARTRCGLCKHAVILAAHTAAASAQTAVTAQAHRGGRRIPRYFTGPSSPARAQGRRHVTPTTARRSQSADSAAHATYASNCGRRGAGAGSITCQRQRSTSWGRRPRQPRRRSRRRASRSLGSRQTAAWRTRGACRSRQPQTMSCTQYRHNQGHG